MDSFLLAVNKYAEFSGRSRRKEYWMFTLFVILIYLGLAFAGGLLIGLVHQNNGSMAGLVFLAPAYLFILAMIIPSLAVCVRRLHDTGRSGWWYCINFVPFVGGIIFLVFMCQDSQMGPNLYGPNPKGVDGFAPYPSLPQSF
jgi:uncharacterized membrane protein YhaH (DUF805 family)